MAEPNWANRTIWTGDNLPIMRGMNSESVDLIYLDPPFNSKANYAAPIGSVAAGAEFKDTWTLDDVDVAWLDLIEAKHPKLNRVIQAAMTKSDQSYLIYMAARVLEMRRLLKPTGSIYLHCDPTMSHYLKLMMDAVFGRSNFRNEIAWERTIGRSDAQRFARVHDVILYYHCSNDSAWYGCWIPLTDKQIERDYRYEDERGRFQPTSLTAQGLSGGGYRYEFQGHDGPWRYPESRMTELEAQNRIWLPKKERGWPRYKRYLSESRGIAARDVITDIKPAMQKERTGYPTQKPLDLLDRIIKASSKEGDVVLDPFCGCATTLVSADRLERDWIGIDISDVAVMLVEKRIRADQGLFQDITARTDVPQRDDLGKIPKYNAKANKERLYGEQRGHCNGCHKEFPYVNMTIDHIIARAHGGTDHIENLQLLCGHCNSVKGDRGQDYLLARLAE